MPTTQLDVNKGKKESSTSSTTDAKVIGEVENPIKPSEEKKILPTMRKIIIETDGNIAKLSLAEVAGKFELISILQTIINLVQQADIRPNMK